ncbi:FAD-dependent monooxygenase [Mycobacterium sp. 21AC1]|uniref:FAD-dependent oxidoreductase n=1 Tax=[Mycobacterium] appelbergii TaxID=2939269 RepID=UPI002938EF34|nr:NAD(P)/FAD-dependent oxidoreductase [Mycobacterium sp. 21AC1]MDV3124588.1 FAD-dependent monooxygenase [Mycobacterium sp. 21AC1]
MDAEVVVVGGGIAGCALAVRLATAGLAVTVLEREQSYRDIVRGEAMVPWGFAEAAEIGVADTILRTAGVSVMTKMVPYDEGVGIDQARWRSRDLSAVVPTAPGVVGVGHPELREALATAAVKVGATVVRGVRRTTIRPDEAPTVSYDTDSGTRTIVCRLIVGADGKMSSVRSALGARLFTTQARVRLSGMLVDDAGVWDRAETAISVDGRNQYIVLPRADNRLRLYVGRGVDDPEPLRGSSAVGDFMNAFRTPIFPDSDALAASAPIGPCATFPMNDAWVDEPAVPGAVLIGDAAGWSNPVTAQGLSIAMRDVRVLSEVLLDTAVWTPQGLARYVEERRTRMARLRFASALTDLLTGFGMPERAARRSRMFGLLRSRPELGLALEAVHTGPWSPPAEAYSPDILSTLALA